jgi:hypothetical protein
MKRLSVLLAAILLLAVTLSGCSSLGLNLGDNSIASDTASEQPSGTGSAAGNGTPSATTGSETASEDDNTPAQSVTPGQTIAKDGTYTVSGNMDGQILVTAQTVTLILDSATIKCADGAGILGYYGGGKQNLTVQIIGTSTVTSTTSHGIQGKDNLNVTGDGTVNISAGKDGLHAGDILTVKSGVFKITAKDDGAQCGDSTKNTGEINITGGNFTINADAKGIKGGGAIMVSAGAFNITSADDSVHSNTDVAIKGGDFTLSSGDDGIHADNALNVSGGNINVTKSYEGLEGTAVNITAGTITVISSDDGINAAGGTNASVGGGRYGNDRFAGGSSAGIAISGGTVTLYTTSDGIDSNGTLDISGGTIAVFIGTTRDGDATDVDSGGTIQPALYGTGNIATGTKLAVGDLWNITLASNVTSYCLIIPGVVNGQSYKITANGSALATVTATTTIQGMMGGGNAGGMGGRGGRR